MQFDPGQALASAMSLFWRKGYEATSLQDLLKATGLSKSSLYQTFGSKRALFERSLDLYRREMVARMR
jgi:TetR/AcrR family transcriptional repressor of nem operon